MLSNTKVLARPQSLALKPLVKSKKVRNSKLAVLFGLGSLLAVSSALPAYAQSNFLGQFIDLQTIGYIFIIANIASVIAILLFPNLIKRLSNYFTSLVIMTTYGAALLGMSIASNSALAIATIILFVISSNLIWINMDLLIESFSQNKSTGRTRTMYFTFINAGWILSPLVSSYLIELGEYNLTFLVAAILVIPCFIILLHYAKDFKHKINYDHKSLWPVTVRMWGDKNRRNIFFISFLLQLFYSSAVIYVPFYLLHNLGMEWEVLGPIFSLMLVPFLLIEIPAGIIADKYIGEKEMLIAGFLILSVSLFLFYYISVPIVWLWAMVLFLSRIGAALVEAMRESYFFKIVDAKDLIDINLFRITGPLAYIVSSVLSIIVLYFFALQYLFLILGVVMLLGLTFSAGLRDTK